MRKGWVVLQFAAELGWDRRLRVIGVVLICVVVEVDHPLVEKEVIEAFNIVLGGVRGGDEIGSYRVHLDVPLWHQLVDLLREDLLVALGVLQDVVDQLHAFGVVEVLLEVLGVDLNELLLAIGDLLLGE